MTLLLVIGLITAVVTFVLSIVVYRVALKFKLYPRIRERDVHTRPTPRLGGVAMFLGIVIAFGAAYLFTLIFPNFGGPLLGVVFSDPTPVLAILGAALLIVVIGVADDLWDLDWMTKLAGQFVAAGLVAWLGVQIYSLPLGGGVTVGSPWMSVAMTVITIVLVMNAINFIDGLDGLVAGVALIANGAFFIYSYLITVRESPSNYFSLASVIAIILVGACAGFLPLNWHPARMFMGDTGALLVGLLMASSAIAVTGQFDPVSLSQGGASTLFPAFIPIILPFAVLIIPLLDFALAVFRRVQAGKSPFSADRQHLHHRLLDMGHSHLQAVLIFYAWTAVVSVGCLLFWFQPVWPAVVFLCIGLVACTVFTLAPLGRRKSPASRSAPIGHLAPASSAPATRETAGAHAPRKEPTR